MIKNYYRYFMFFSASAAALLADDVGAPGTETMPEAVDAVDAVDAEASIPDVPEAELVEMTGYLTALGGGISSLKLDDASIESLTAGFVAGLKGEANVTEFPREEMDAAFAQAQARAEAVQGEAETLPEITADALNKIGMVVVMQSGLTELGFGADELDSLRSGFIAGAKATEMDPAIEAKMPAFQAWIQPRVQQVQAKMMMEQQAAAEAAQAELKAEFEPIAKEWMDKDPMTVVMETTQGNIEIELMPAIAPLAVANFVQLVEDGYYNGLTFHRVIPEFMIQGGDPQGTGAGGESVWGKPFPDEFSPEARFDTEGLLAMANAGPMTNGSQFFITTSKPEFLNDKHTIFGKVTTGYDVVEKIEGVETGEQDKPVEDQKIVKAYVK